MPVTPLVLLFFLLLLGGLIALFEIGLLSLAFDHLGLSPGLGFLVLAGSLLGSHVNLPLRRLRTEPPPEAVLPRRLHLVLYGEPPPFHGETLLAVNLGGCIIPVLVSLYLILANGLSLAAVAGAVATVALVSYLFSRPIPGMGIGMPMFIPPITAALAAFAVAPDATQAAPLAYVGGTLGVLVGADLMRLGDIRQLGAPVASIGGAGTFDGIFMTGIVAVLLT